MRLRRAEENQIKERVSKIFGLERKNRTLRTNYTRREALPVGISPMHFGWDVVMPELMMMMMMMMVGVVVVMMMMMIAVLLSMIPRRIRAMNRVGRVGGSQRQRVHPLFWSRGARVMQHKRSKRCRVHSGDGSVVFLRYRVCPKKTNHLQKTKEEKKNLMSSINCDILFYDIAI